jgi:hypothetical protein
MRSSAVSDGLQRGHHAAPVLVLRTVEQFWLYLRACYARRLTRTGWAPRSMTSVRRASRAGHSRTDDHGAQSSDVAPGPVVAGALRRHVLRGQM